MQTVVELASIRIVTMYTVMGILSGLDPKWQSGNLSLTSDVHVSIVNKLTRDEEIGPTPFSDMYCD
jgi:hypothetical protein